MKSFPMFIDVVGQTIVVVGGEEQAAQKARLALKTEAEIVFVADALEPEIAELVRRGRARHAPTSALAEEFRAARFAFIANGCAGADAAAAAVAKSMGVLVNVVDRPELCDLTTPAIVDRDPVVVAIGTEGTAPVLARQVKTRIEEMLEPRLGELAALAGRLRTAVAQRVPRARHRAFWRWVFSGAPRKLFVGGREADAAADIKSAIEAGGAEIGPRDGFVSLVGAGPGASDLMTLRGVQRLQEADVIFYDRLVDPGVLELARRDAERVYVGKAVNGTAWPQDRINGVIAAAARSGKRVVRLKSGDPLVFGRAAEEAEALEAAGVAWEIVPGVTSALAAAAQAKIFPTERGVAQRLTLATGQSAAGAPPPDFSRLAAPGSTSAFYMCVANAGAMSCAMMAAGAPNDLAISIVENTETARARRLDTTLEQLETTIRREQVKNPAILFVKWPQRSTRKRRTDHRTAIPAVA
ncbi:MAG: siroheme synthase CysG [Pseudomonadota bacterium]